MDKWSLLFIRILKLFRKLVNDVTEEHTAFVFKVKQYAQSGDKITKHVVTQQQHDCQVCLWLY